MRIVKMSVMLAAIVTGVVGWGMAASAQTVLQCVQYVKQQKPEYAKPLANGQTWVHARDLWDFVYDVNNPKTARNRGPVATAESIAVFDVIGLNTSGHAAIVKELKKDSRDAVIGFVVSHANWTPGKIETGTYWIKSRNKVTYNNGTKEYPLRGFVYRPQ